MFKHVPWPSHSDGKSDGKPQGEEQSLTTILNIDQRGDLTLLIASIMATMRKTIDANFDATVRYSTFPKFNRNNIWRQAALNPDLIKPLASEDEKIMNVKTDPGSVDVNKYDQEKKLKEQRQKELSAPKVKELKSDALRFIDEWRTSVIERVGSIVNSKEEASSQMHSASSKESAINVSDKKIDPASADSEAADAALKETFPPIDTPLSSLEEPTKILILHSTLLLVLSLEHYIAPSRVLLLYLTSSLHLPLSVLTADEEKVAKGLLEAAKNMSGDSETQKKAEENKNSRKWKVGLASVAGAALIGVTGGLAAPLVAAGVGSVMGGLGLGATAAAGYLGTVAGSTVIVGGLFGAYGGRMTGQMMDAYAAEVSDFAFIPLQKARKSLKDRLSNSKSPSDKEKATKDPSSNTSKHFSPSEESAITDPSSRRLRVTIGISGWLTSAEDVTNPWHVLGSTAEVFALRYELESLMNLGNSLQAMVSSAAWGAAKSELIKHTIFAELSAALWPIALLKISRVVDNPFSIARSRSDKAGEVLADALINKAQGERPVTLIGYSLGARVIYACLMSLAKRKAFGLVESAVLIGAPCPSTTGDWRVMRSVVASRLVNVFSENDYVLGFLYRTSSIQYGVAGLQKVDGLPGVENVDVSETVSGHLRYRYLVGSILRKIGFEDVDLKAVEEEATKLKQMDEEEEMKGWAEKAQAQGKSIVTGADGKMIFGKDGKPVMEKVWRGGKKDEGNGKGESSEAKEGSMHEKESEEEEARRMEKEVQEKTESGLLQGMAQKLHIGK